MRAPVFIIFLLLSYHPFLYALDTELKLYRPFGQAIAQESLVIKEVYKGECVQQSTRIKREDAWRCKANDNIYDPCFINPYDSRTIAICPQSPWVGSSVELHLNAPVNNSQHRALDLSKTYPWGLELVSGEKCQALGRKDFFDGLLVRYQCDNEKQLIGHLQRCKMPWSILIHSPNGPVETAEVVRAWF